MTDNDIAIHELIARLERRWVLPVPSFDRWHPYDPLPVHQFLKSIEQISVYAKGKNFIDLGCGIGTKLSLMFSLGWKVSGIDFYERYIEICKEFIPEANTSVQDIRDLKKLDYDVIYMYRPALSDEDEDEIEQHVVSLMNQGSILYLPLRKISTLNLTPINSEIGVK